MNSDLIYLIKDKEEHTQKELQEKWIEIYDEYIQLMGSQETQIYFKDYLDLHFLQIKKMQIESAIRIQNVVFEFNINIDKYTNFINKVKKEYRITDLKTAHKVTVDKLNLKLKDFKIKYSSKDKEGIDDVIPILLERGFHINRHTTVVSEWCGIINRLKEQANKQKDNG